MIMMITGIALGVLALLIVMTITGRMNYASELESQLSSVLEEALWNLTAEKEYTVSDTEEFLADVVENLAAALDAETGLSVRIQRRTWKKGCFPWRWFEAFTIRVEQRGMCPAAGRFC